MNTLLLAALACATAMPARGETETFDSTAIGALPAGWKGGVTGRGSPRWAVAADPGAPSGGQVLRQDGSGTFPWCVKADA